MLETCREAMLAAVREDGHSLYHAADVSASLHNPLTKTGRPSAVGKRNRASYEAEFFLNARI